MNCKTILSMLAAVLLMAGVSFANADQFDVGDHLNKMKRELNLTDDQVKAVKPILEDYKNNLERAHKEKKERLSAVLSSEQMSRLKDMKKEHEAKMKEYKKERGY